MSYEMYLMLPMMDSIAIRLRFSITYRLGKPIRNEMAFVEKLETFRGEICF